MLYNFCYGACCINFFKLKNYALLWQVDIESLSTPLVFQINGRLHAVQDELHEISRKLEVTRMPGYSHPPEYPPVAAYQTALHLRAEELKEEFVELITELRKRRTGGPGSVAIDVEVRPFFVSTNGKKN